MKKNNYKIQHCTGTHMNTHTNTHRKRVGEP